MKGIYNWATTVYAVLLYWKECFLFGYKHGGEAFGPLRDGITYDVLETMKENLEDDVYLY